MGNIVSLNSPVLEKYIVAYLMKDRNFFLKVGQYLQTDHYNKKSRFDDSKYQLIVNIICLFNKNYKRFPTKDEFNIFFDRMINEDSFKQTMLSTLDSVMETDISKVDPEYLKSQTIDFIKKFRAVDATLENQADIEAGKMDMLSERMQNAVNINFDKDLGVSVENPEEALGLIKETLDDSTGISTGSPTLDRIMGKPIAGEELVFIGVPGAGKTLWLGNVAMAAMKEGKKVVVFSLEVNERRLLTRYYQSIFNKTKQEVLEMNPADAEQLFNMDNSGRIKIKTYKANTASSNDFAAYLGDLKTYENFEPDAIIVDYVGIMSINDRTISKDNSYQYVKIATEELRNLACEFHCPVFTAGQINREGMGDKGGSKGVVTTKDIAESRGIVDTADYIIDICQTAAEKYTDQKTKTDGIYRLRVDKDRNGESGAEVKFNIHWPTLQLSESHEK
jgi:replicative DNA helicase